MRGFSAVVAACERACLLRAAKDMVMKIVFHQVTC